MPFIMQNKKDEALIWISLFIKTGIFPVVTVFGGIFSGVLGGFHDILMALLVCMIADYIIDLILAIVFKNSIKIETGGAQNKVGFIFIVKKIFILILIVVINQIDTVTNTMDF